MTGTTLAPPVPTAPETIPPHPLPPILAPWLRPFSVSEYHRLIELGILTEEDDAELLNGWIVRKMSRNPPHDTALALVSEALRAVLPADWFCRGQSAVTTSRSEPEPDVTVVRGPIRRYAHHHPRPDDIALAVEVADSSVTLDRTVKGPIYVRDGIPVYWIVNVPDQQVEVYTDPTGPADEPAYRQQRHYRQSESVPVIVDGREVGTIPVSDVLP